MNAYQTLTAHKSIVQKATYANKDKNGKVKGFTLKAKVFTASAASFSESVQKDGIKDFKEAVTTELADGSKDTYTVGNKVTEETPLTLQVAMALEMMGFAPKEEKEAKTPKAKKNATVETEAATI